MELETLLDRLAHLVWAPEGRQYLLTAVGRLQQLVGDAELADLSGISTSDLQSLSSRIAETASVSSSEYARLKRLSDDTSAETTKHHPFFGIRDAHPGFILLLTALPSNHQLSGDLDELLADVLQVVVRLNLAVDFGTYQADARSALRSRLRGEAVALEDCQPSAHLLRIISRSLRRLVQTASQEQASLSQVTACWEQFQKAANSYIANPLRPRRHAQRSSGLKRETRTTIRHKDGLELLNVRSPLQLEVLEFSSIELDADEAPIEQHIYPHGTFAKARTLDLSPIELVKPAPAIGRMVNEHHSARTAIVDGRYQAKLMENRAQLLLWSTANLTPFQVRKLTTSLISIARDQSLRGFAAAWLMAALVTGRKPMLLPGKVVLDAQAKDANGLTSYDETDTQIIFLTGIEGIALRVNKTPVITRLESPFVQETRSWIVVPDYLGVGALLAAHMRQLQLGDDLEALKAAMLRQTIEHGLAELATLGFSESHVWQLLPRIMQNESGMSTGMAMLTDWSTANSIVELHYHCIPATALIARYQSAMHVITEGFDGRHLERDQRLPKQQHFVGAPNCPTPKFTEELVLQVKKKLSRPMPLEQRHNLLAIYTLIIATAGFGLRHAISPEIEFADWGNSAVVSYLEKGELRQLVLPKMVLEQLKVFAQSLQATSFDPPKASKHAVRFTLLDAQCRSRDLKPGSFSKELAVFGIDFPFELNAYRRWMFSQLFMAGVRGITSDHFGGHGVAGREPFSAYSATTIGSMEKIAATMDQRMTAAGFEVLS